VFSSSPEAHKSGEGFNMRICLMLKIFIVALLINPFLCPADTPNLDLNKAKLEESKNNAKSNIAIEKGWTIV